MLKHLSIFSSVFVLGSLCHIMPCCLPQFILLHQFEVRDFHNVLITLSRVIKGTYDVRVFECWS